MLWFTIFIFNQREINYGKWTGPKGEKEVSDWHCHPSQRLLPEDIIPDLVMPGMLGTSPSFSATPSWSCSFSKLSVCSLCRSVTHLWVSSKSDSDCPQKKKMFIVRQNGHTACFLIVFYLLWTRPSTCVGMTYWVSARRKQASPKARKEPRVQRVILPASFSDGLQISIKYCFFLGGGGSVAYFLLVVTETMCVIHHVSWQALPIFYFLNNWK